MDLIELKKNIFNRAKFFIEDMNHFAPFGAKLIGNKIQDVVVYDDSKEVFEGEDFINRLKKNFSSEIKDNLIQAGAIAFDVTINVKNADGKSEKRDALCLITSKDGENWDEEYFPYMIIEGKCIWR